jgi:hypothetical protein
VVRPVVLGVAQPLLFLRCFEVTHRCQTWLSVCPAIAVSSAPNSFRRAVHLINKRFP